MQAEEGTPYEENKTIHKAFKVTDQLELEILSKYGDITIDTWEKDSVSFDISIKVITNDPETSAEFIEDVTVEFNQTDDYISAITEWNRYNSKIKKTALDVATFFGRERKIEVNYNIKLPEDSEVDIENNFGDINLSNLNGNIKIDASHGDIRMRKVKNIKKLKLSYGKLKIKEVKNASIEIHYGNVDIQKAKDVNLESTSSDIEIDEVNKLKLSSKHDKIELEEIKDINFSSSWSNIDIDNLSGNIVGDIKYGDFTVNEIATSFSGTELSGHATDIELNFASQIAFVYDISLVNGKRFSIPSTGNSTTKAENFGEISEYQGTFATIPVGGLPAKVTIKVKSSYVDIRLAD